MQNFIQPSKEQLKQALGNIKNEDKNTQQALNSIDKYWKIIDKPTSDEWQFCYPKDGWQTFDNFKGKIINDKKNVLYIQPLLLNKNSQISQNLLKGLEKWLKYFYQNCKIVILENMYESDLNIIETQNYGHLQYNAIDLLKKVIGPIQNEKKDAIGVISFTDLDLFTKQLSNYCFGYGIPAYGGIQSVYRFTSDFTGEKYKDKESEQLQMLMRVCKIATHEIGHMFMMNHCTYYECLMKGTNHLQQTDKHPLYFCVICYRKLNKCLNINHLHRYNNLSQLCKEFGGPFVNKQSNGISPYQWFTNRYDDLSKILQINNANNQNKGRAVSLNPLKVKLDKENTNNQKQKNITINQNKISNDIQNKKIINNKQQFQNQKINNIQK